MKILVTSAASRTGEIAATQLLHYGSEVHLTDTMEGARWTRCELDDDAATDDLVCGMDAIVNVGYEGYASSDAGAMIDYYTRRVYNLLWSASDAGVRRVINLSTLRLMESYEENLVVTENWRSRPLASDVGLLCAHLCETVCKEFARDGKIVVANLRLGWPIVNGGRDSVRESGGRAALSAIDLGTAIDKALTAELEPWQDLHLQSPLECQRYLTVKAEQLLELR